MSPQSAGICQSANLANKGGRRLTAGEHSGRGERGEEVLERHDKFYCASVIEPERLRDHNTYGLGDVGSIIRNEWKKKRFKRKGSGDNCQVGGQELSNGKNEWTGLGKK